MEVSNIKFPSSGSQADTSGHMDECIDMMKLKVAFCEYADKSNRYTFNKLQTSL